jgi:hypothetical protein
VGLGLRESADEIGKIGIGRVQRCAGAGLVSGSGR